jgi:hypothetical protein
MSEIAQSTRPIENLIAAYAEYVDGGDFEALGGLMSHCDFSLNGGDPVHGAEAITKLGHDTLKVHADGTPRTHHITTNIIIEIDTATRSAISRSYFTVIQQAGEHPLQIVAAGHYRDRFDHDGTEWHFAAREVITDFVGDVSEHVNAKH